MYLVAFLQTNSCRYGKNTRVLGKMVLKYHSSEYEKSTDRVITNNSCKCENEKLMYFDNGDTESLI